MFHVKDVADGKRRIRSALTARHGVLYTAVPLRAAEASEAMWITRLFRHSHLQWIFTSVEYTAHETYAKKINGNGGRMAS